MVLSSQSARPYSLRRFSSSRKPRHTLRHVLIATAIVAFVAWRFWPQAPAGIVVVDDDQSGQLDAGTDNAKATAAAAALVRSAQSQRTLAEAAAEQEQFLRQLRGEDRSTWNITPNTGPATPAQPARGAGMLNPSGTAANASANNINNSGTSNSANSATNLVPSLTLGANPNPSANDLAASDQTDKSDKTRTTNRDDTPSRTAADGPLLALATPPATSAISEMVGRLQFTTPTPPGSAGAMLREGMNQIADGKLVQGRRTLSRVLTAADPSVTASDARTIRDTLASINKSLVFSDRVAEDDTLAEHYTIVSGDLLSTVARRYKLTYQFIEQINSVDARRIRVGQKLKVIKGPFHAIVDKSDYRMDVYAKDTDGQPIYVISFAVGLGKDDSTPIGSFICRQGGKLENPSWTHPRTGKFYAADDPLNPIGEYWIALQGTDDHTKGVRGYGIHGTIEPESIGKQASLGCVRMAAKDIEQVYRLLVDGQSTVMIQP